MLYVSYSSDASSSIESRDTTKTTTILDNLNNVKDSTQCILCIFSCESKYTNKLVAFIDLINVVLSNNLDVCLVVLDYIHLCTDHTNIVQFVK